MRRTASRIASVLISLLVAMSPVRVAFGCLHDAAAATSQSGAQTFCHSTAIDTTRHDSGYCDSGACCQPMAAALQNFVTDIPALAAAVAQAVYLSAMHPAPERPRLDRPPQA
ncbi:MAG: hypothetical protein KDG50_02220 [Chromatiales bacterium]|nr:hypothetical protein [Chromatiales bacterium]